MAAVPRVATHSDAETDDTALAPRSARGRVSVHAPASPVGSVVLKTSPLALSATQTVGCAHDTESSPIGRPI
jgi:hypothetical protein